MVFWVLPGKFSLKIPKIFFPSQNRPLNRPSLRSWTNKKWIQPNLFYFGLFLLRTLYGNSEHWRFGDFQAYSSNKIQSATKQVPKQNVAILVIVVKTGCGALAIFLSKIKWSAGSNTAKRRRGILKATQHCRFGKERSFGVLALAIFSKDFAKII